MILIGSDHGGFELKETIKEFLDKKCIPFEDVGTASNDPADYPDYAIEVARRISEKKSEAGILICGTGIGMSIVANKFPGVRATLCSSTFTARMSKEHNNSNILILGGRTLEPNHAIEITDVWLNTPFGGGRHQKRLDIISALEEELFGKKYK